MYVVYFLASYKKKCLIMRDAFRFCIKYMNISITYRYGHIRKAITTTISRKNTDFELICLTDFW